MAERWLCNAWMKPVIAKLIFEGKPREWRGSAPWIFNDYIVRADTDELYRNCSFRPLYPRRSVRSTMLRYSMAQRHTGLSRSNFKHHTLPLRHKQLGKKTEESIPSIPRYLRRFKHLPFSYRTINEITLMALPIEIPDSCNAIVTFLYRLLVETKIAKATSKIRKYFYCKRLQK